MRYTTTTEYKEAHYATPHQPGALRVVMPLLVLIIVAAIIAVGLFSTGRSTAFAHDVTPPTAGPASTPTSDANKKSAATSTSDTNKKSAATSTPATPKAKGDDGGKDPTLTSTAISTATPKAKGDDDDKHPTRTSTATPTTIVSMPTFIINMTPIPEQRYEGWERPTLRDLAEVNAWPTTVIYDTAGRLRVQNNAFETNWTVRAHVRAFDFGAGASAAFNAEQEDAQLAGFHLTPQTFYTYRAYEGRITDDTGEVREARFRWLVRTWIFGIDVRPAPGQSMPDMRLLSEQLLTLATSRGLPPPPIQVPTPNPTWHLPPNATPTVQGCGVSFSDVTPTYWAYRFIIELACSGKITGYEDGTFRPESPTTRSQIAKMLVLTQNWPVVTPRTQSFQDVSRAHPFYQYIETAALHGVVSGYDDGAYQPDAYVTRAQLAKMLVLSRGWQPFQENPVVLCDVPHEHWAWHYVQAAFQNGLYSGYEGSCFRPDAQANRAELAKLLVFASR